MDILLQVHSYLRYFILITLVGVVILALRGWLGNKPFGKLDDKMGLYLLIFTHLQLVAGVILYFSLVEFNSETMKNAVMRYWAVEHVTGMLVAIVLITIGRTSSKKMPTALLRHRRLFIFNSIALVVILVVLATMLKSTGLPII